MWVAKSISHTCTLVSGISGNASSLTLPWNSKIPKSRKWPKYEEGFQGCCGATNGTCLHHRSRWTFIHSLRALWAVEMFELFSNKRKHSLIYILQLCQVIYNPRRVVQVWIFIVMNVKQNDLSNKKFLELHDARDAHRHCLTFKWHFVKKFIQSKRKIAE